MASTSMKAKAVQANNAAEQFIKLYYEKPRSSLGKIFYLDSSIMVWNGNTVQGSVEAIQKFLDSLPTATTKVESLDAQPITNAGLDATSILVSVSGVMTFEGHPQQLFTQNFILIEHKQTWKIVSDTIRIVK